MTAYVDAMIFLTVMVLAVGVTVHVMPHADTDVMDPEDFLNILGGIKLRASDVTLMDDESLVYLTDLLAHPIGDDEGPFEYLRSILDSLYGPDGYRISLSTEGWQRSFGNDGFCRRECSSEVRLTDGGALVMKLGIL